MREAHKTRVLPGIVEPRHLGDWLVHSGICLDMQSGHLWIKFESPACGNHGIVIDADPDRSGDRKAGTLELADGRKVSRLLLWHGPELAREATYAVRCPRACLSVHNVYRVYHNDGWVSRSSWTGDAGMTLLGEDSGVLRIGCNDWRSPFDPTKLVFRIACR